MRNLNCEIQGFIIILSFYLKRAEVFLVCTNSSKTASEAGRTILYKTEFKTFLGQFHAQYDFCNSRFHQNAVFLGFSQFAQTRPRQSVMPAGQDRMGGKHPVVEVLSDFRQNFSLLVQNLCLVANCSEYSPSLSRFNSFKNKNTPGSVCIASNSQRCCSKIYENWMLVMLMMTEAYPIRIFNTKSRQSVQGDLLGNLFPLFLSKWELSCKESLPQVIPPVLNI